jgi:hypothetical protein
MAKRSDGPPDDEEPGISELEDAVLGILEEAGVSSEVNDKVMKLINDAEKEHDALRQTFDLQWQADQRAILKWQAAHPGNELVWPDRQELTSWLLGKMGNSLFSVHVIRRKGARERVHPTVTFLVLGANRRCGGPTMTTAIYGLMCGAIVLSLVALVGP